MAKKSSWESFKGCFTREACKDFFYSIGSQLRIMAVALTVMALIVGLAYLFFHK